MISFKFSLVKISLGKLKVAPFSLAISFAIATLISFISSFKIALLPMASNFVREISSKLLPNIAVWSKPIGVKMLSSFSKTFVASSTPPMPASQTK